MVENGTSSSNSNRKSFTSREPSYKHLAEVLAKLGYRIEKRAGSHVVFRRKGNPSLVLPWRAATQKVDRTRLAGVYQMVSGGGVATRQKLDELLNGH